MTTHIQSIMVSRALSLDEANEIIRHNNFKPIKDVHITRGFIDIVFDDRIFENTNTELGR